MEMTEYDRLKEIAEKYFTNLTQVALKIGKTKQHLHGYKNRDSLGSQLINELKEKLNINPDYIRYGKEPIFLEEEQPGMVREPRFDYGSIRIENINNVSKEDIERLSKIKMYSISAKAYEAKVLYNFEDIPISSITLNVGIPLDPEKYIAVRVSGFSMKDAGIEDGDIILVDITKKEIIANKIFLLSLNGVLMVKRINIEDGVIKLISANNGIEPFIINHIDDELIIHGQVRITLKYNY
jgi:DNA polymerase V